MWHTSSQSLLPQQLHASILHPLAARYTQYKHVQVEVLARNHPRDLSGASLQLSLRWEAGAACGALMTA
jgi:hypothetical protein